MASRTTYSGSIGRFRQGISLRTFKQLFDTSMPHLFGGDGSMLIEHTGSTSPKNYFDDRQANWTSPGTIGSNAKYRLVVSHDIVRLNFGDLELFELPDPTSTTITPFDDQQQSFLTGSPEFGLWMMQPENTGSVPLRLRYKSIVELGQMDGVIEPLGPIRKMIDFTAPLSFDRRSRLHVSITTDYTDEEILSYNVPGVVGIPSPCPMYPITQWLDFREFQNNPMGQIRPFDDRSNGVSGSLSAAPSPYPLVNQSPSGTMILSIPPTQITDIPTYQRAGTELLGNADINNVFYQNFMTSSIVPFSDMTAQEGKLETCFSTKGRGITMRSGTIETEFMKMTGSTDDSMFGLGQYSTSAGYSFPPGRLTGSSLSNVAGTDSLAFGGWLK